MFNLRLLYILGLSAETYSTENRGEELCVVDLPDGRVAYASSEIDRLTGAWRALPRDERARYAVTDLVRDGRALTDRATAAWLALRKGIRVVSPSDHLCALSDDEFSLLWDIFRYGSAV